MEVELIKGNRFSLSKEVPNLKRIAVGLGWQVSIPGQTYDIDASVFMLGIDGKVPEEGYFVFYNNLQSPDGSLTHSGDSRTGQQRGDLESIYIDLVKVNADIHQIVFVVTIHEANETNQNFSQVKGAFIRLYDQDTGKELTRYPLNETFSQETALEFGRLYRKDGEWRFQAVGQGYNTGLQTFVEKYHVELAQKESPEDHAVLVQNNNYISSNKDTIHQNIDIKKPANIEVLKAKVDTLLKKKGIYNVVARVALVLDISGSMSHQYSSGAVQAFVERIVPVASRLDDDGVLDVWFFGSKFKRTKAMKETNVNGYLKKECGELKRALLFFEMPSLMLELGGGNNEPPVIRDVIKKYTQEEPSNLPTLVVFLSDGGVIDDKGIKEAVVDAAKYPIFWQFVGLAGSSYGILKKLDTMGGRIIDNANFFHVDDLGKTTDDQLYELLMNEFPSWLNKARQKGILK